MNKPLLPSLAAAACLALLAFAARAEVMKQTVAHVMVPAHSSPIPLRGLFYKGRFTAEITAVRLHTVPDEAADPVDVAWVFSGRNTDGQMHRVGVTVTLVDESGADLADATLKTALRPGAKDQEIKVPMSVPGSTWKSARRMRIGVNFF